MTMKKKLLSVAVGAALGASAVCMNVQADELLFPAFIEQGGSAFTFLTLRSDGVADPVAAGTAGTNPALSAGQIHYVWSYTNADGVCIHADRTGNMTANDLIQQTVVDPTLGAGIDLPAEFDDLSTARYLLVPNVFGFLTVRDTSLEGAFGGQAIIIDNITGTVSAYKGFNDPTNLFDDFTSILVSHRSHDFTWYPTAGNLVNTSWFMVVTGFDMDVGSGWTGAVRLDLGFDGVFDRDENFHSGEKTTDIVCNALVELDDLLNAAQLNGTVMGGWAWVTQALLPNGGGDPADFNPAVDDARGTLAFKIETTTALGPIKTAVSTENAFPNFPY